MYDKVRKLRKQSGISCTYAIKKEDANENVFQINNGEPLCHEATRRSKTIKL
jgi:hypothetical protein